MRRPVDLDQDRVVALVLRLSGPAILGISAHALQMLVNARGSWPISAPPRSPPSPWRTR
ncbi:hypothetical protein R1A27_29485 [Methylobacterium sp. NMS12]|uniref:hypothetical protein n=1 Tax=Methylobacterium sp. NMS12 TaxID=3079766 RepID=UPI003F8847ED